MDDRIMQVGAGGSGGEYLKVEVECLFEVVADVLYHLLLCCGGEA